MVAAPEEGLKALNPAGRVPSGRIMSGALAALLFAASAVPLAAAVLGRNDPLDYVCYSPYRDGQSPGGPEPTEAQIRADFALMTLLVKGIRTYSATGINARIPELAGQAGLEVYVGAWIGTDEAANQAEVDALIALAKSGNRAIKGLIVGNEVLLRGDVTEARLLAYIQKVRDAGTGIPVTTADIYQDLIDHAAALAPVIDFALCHVHPYWEGVAAQDAAARVLQAWSSVKAKYPGKTVMVGETGFPSAGQAQGAAVPSEDAQARFLGQLLPMAWQSSMPIMWFDAFDEAWKGAEGPVGAHWGLWKSDRSKKPAADVLIGITLDLGRRPAYHGAPDAVWDAVPRALRVDAMGRLRGAPAQGLAEIGKDVPALILFPALKP